MDYIGFVQYGEMFEYRNKIKKTGVKMSFEKGTDVYPFLKRRDSVIYIDTGMLYFRLFKPDGLYIQLMAFNEGNVLPLFNTLGEGPYGDMQMLVAARGTVTGYVLQRAEYRRWREKDSRFARLVDEQERKIFSYLYVSQILYRDGPCITRISNLLCHVYYYKDYEREIFPIGQEELACTVGESKSQVKRALSRLRNEGAVELKYEQIVIKDISIIKKYISDSMWTEELAYEEKKIRES